MPPIEEIEKRLKETADLVEKGLEDIQENKTSKTQVLDLIEERTSGDKELITKARTDIDELNTGVGELKAVLDELQKKLRAAKAAEPTELSLGASRYNGKFSSPFEAKRFALLVMAAVTAAAPKLKEQYDAACKALDDMGCEPYWLDPTGRKTMTGSSQAGGGALVTIEQSPTIIKLLEDYGRYRANARNMPMGAGTTLVPKIDGLLTVYCPGEGGAITKSDPTIKTVSLTPKTLCALTAFSMELEDDSLVALGELLADLFARSFAYYEDLCGFLGDGTSTYFGFTGITGALRAVDATIGNIKSLVVGAGNAYSELTLANFESVVGTLPNFADNGEARWYVHRYFYFTVMVKLALAVGGVNATEVLQGVRKKEFLSYPVDFTQVMPKAEGNSQICALLANLRMGAYLGTRGGLEFATSDQRYFDQGLIAVRGRDRCAINVHGVGDTTNAGPICGLITAAS